MLSKEEIQHVAQLARISLHENEIEKYQKELSSILDYFDELQKIDTDNVEPIGHITGMLNHVRSDKSFDIGDKAKEDILNNAPERKDNFIKVKSVL